MQEVLLFSGTSEGRKLAEILSAHGMQVMVCVATEYGQEVMEESERIEVRVGRLEQSEMEALIGAKEWLAVIDATHPFAAKVTENIRLACKEQNKEVLRLLRNAGEQEETFPIERILAEQNNIKSSLMEQSGTKQIIYVSSVEEAAEYLSQTKGNIFLTTGSKELAQYVEKIPDISRIYTRILPGEAELAKCHELGLKGRQIICMQGPFSEALNLAMLKEINASYLVTKETAKAGGYPEKLRAAADAEVQVVVIKRPKESGYAMEEILKKLGIVISEAALEKEAAKDRQKERINSCIEQMKQEDYENINQKREIALVGIGMGNSRTLTLEACEVIQKAQLLIGAERMIASVPKELKSGKEQFISYQAQEIVSYLKSHSRYKRIAVLLSGDVGFYSGAHLLLETLKGRKDSNRQEKEKKPENAKEQGNGTELENAKERENTEVLYEIKMVCGISSVAYFAAKLGMAWEDMRLMSLHGRNQNIIGALQQNQKVFTLTEGAKGIRSISEELIQYGMKHVELYVGRKLGSEEEEITHGIPEAFMDYEKEGLCVLLLINKKAGENAVSYGIKDTEFLRDKVPMTKEEIRSISLSKLALKRDSVIYDIGAGTGSISIECARISVDGSVYAIEKKPEACELINKNKYRFAAANLKLIRGEAPEALSDLPKPTHVFIGGSGGKLEEILTAVWEKNKKARIVINAISLETAAEVTQLLKKYKLAEKEIIQVTVAKAKEIGAYQMMMGQNPVYIVTLQREVKEL